MVGVNGRVLTIFRVCNHIVSIRVSKYGMKGILKDCFIDVLKHCVKGIEKRMKEHKKE